MCFFYGCSTFDCSGRTYGNDRAGKDPATDRNEAGERALLVDVGTLNGVLWSTETEADILVPAASTLANLLRLSGLSLGVLAAG